MSSTEYERWLAFHQVAPIGLARHDVHTSYLGWVIASVAAGFAGKRAKRPKWTDFIFRWWTGKQEQKPEDVSHTLVSVFASMKAMSIVKRRRLGEPLTEDDQLWLKVFGDFDETKLCKFDEPENMRRMTEQDKRCA